MKKTISFLITLLIVLSMSMSCWAENATILGNTVLGYYDYASCSGLLGEAQFDNVYNFATQSSTDQYGLARIMIIYENCGNNANMNAVESYIYNQYSSTPADDDRYNFKILSEEHTELGGMPAYKISAEKGDLYGFCDTYSYVSYALANSLNGFVHIQLVAPKDGWKNDDGTDFHPTIAELCNIFENTYTRTLP